MVGDWIAADTGRQRPWLCGFSNGAAMAASLLLSNPGAYSGLIMIGGCFAVEDGDLPDNGLLDKPVLFCRGQFDDVIPRHKFEQAEAYRSEEPTSELQSLMRISYADFCLKK